MLFQKKIKYYLENQKKTVKSTKVMDMADTETMKKYMLITMRNLYNELKNMEF